MTAPEIEKADSVLIPSLIFAPTKDQHEAVCCTYNSVTRHPKMCEWKINDGNALE